MKKMSSSLLLILILFINFTSSLSAQTVSGSQAWVNILCKFSDVATEPRTRAEIHDYFGTTYPRLDHYWQTVSYGTIDLTGTATVTDWITLPNTEAYYGADNDLLSDECIAAADSQVDFTAFDGINLFFNGNVGGSARQFHKQYTLDGQTTTFPIIILPDWARAGTVAHEMGHAFGFPHSSGPSSNPPENAALASNWDLMASVSDCTEFLLDGCVQHNTIAYNLENAGWLSGVDIVTVGPGSTQTITLDRTLLPLTGNPLMIRVPIGTSLSDYYYTIEVRDNNSYDVNTNAAGPVVIIHEVDSGHYFDDTYAQVVSSSGDSNDAGAQWIATETYTDTLNNITIEILSNAGTTYDIRVTNNSVDRTPPNDDFANATLMGNSFSDIQTNTTFATREIGEPNYLFCVNAPGNSIWYRYDAIFDGTAQATVSNTDFHESLLVYEGTSFSDLVNVACDTDAMIATNSQANFNIEAGKSYYIAVASTFYTTARGLLDFNFTATLDPDCSSFEAAYSLGDPYFIFANPSLESDLITAIHCANVNGTADTIDLGGNTVNLSMSFADYFGATGLPEISSDISLENGTIDGGMNGFRLIYVDGTGILNIDHMLLTKGQSYNNGGAISSWGTLSINNSTISENVAGGSGGGIMFEISQIPGSRTITNSTISGNSASWGGGIRSWSDMNFNNTIIANNTATATGSDCLISATTAANNNIFGIDGTGGGCPLGASNITPNTAIGNILLPLADNGGPTQTHALVLGSPAIDAADIANCPLDDQRGESRGFDGDNSVDSPQIGDCDIGAFEYTGTSEEVSDDTVMELPSIAVFDPAISKIGFLLPDQVGVTGEELEWIVTVTNTGNAIGTNVIVTDTLVDALQIDSVDALGGNVTINGQTVTVIYPTLSVGESVQFSIFTTVLDGVSITNTACVNADNQGAEECATGVSVSQLPSTGEISNIYAMFHILFIFGVVIFLVVSCSLLMSKTNSKI